LAIEAHLKGKRHLDRLKTEGPPPFQDYTCECGQVLVHVKQFQIDQHLAGKPCMDRRRAMAQQKLMATYVEPVHREFIFEQDQRPAEQLLVDQGVGLAEDDIVFNDSMCPGVEVLPPDEFYSVYPFEIHKPGGVPSCPPVSWLPGDKVVFSRSCTGVTAPGAHLCEFCEELKENANLRLVIEFARKAEPHSSYSRLGIGALSAMLRNNKLVRDHESLRVLALQRKVSGLRGKVDVGSKLVTAIRTKQHARVGQLLDQQLNKGRSLKFCVTLLEDAVVPQLTRTYNEQEHDLALLTSRLGNTRLLYAFHKAGILPSKPFSKLFSRLENPFNLHGVIDLSTLSRLVSTVWGGLPKVPISAHTDEVALAPRLSIDTTGGTSNARFVGLCEHAPQIVPYKNVDSVRDVINKLISGDWHLATHAKVLGVSRHDSKCFRMLPITFEASCNRFTASQEDDRLRDFFNPLSPPSIALPCAY